MLRLLLPFIMGVVVMAFFIELIDWTNGAFQVVLGAILSISLMSILFGGFAKNPKFFGMITWIMMLTLGMALTISVSDQLYPEAISIQTPKRLGSYLIKVIDEPQLKPNSIKVVAELTEDSLRMIGKVLLYFEPDSLSSNLEYGNILLVKTQLEEVENLGNPNEFNYKRYLRFNGIGHRGYVGSGNAEFLSRGNSGFRGRFFKARSFLIEKLKEAQLAGNELAVVSALILGYRAELDRELVNAYAGAGATHVLAVSGLHVGIVYLVLNTLLRFMDRRRKTKVLKTILLVILLFGYAGLTGLSASVFRAATMFSFVAIGKAIKRDTNIFNTLAASAFCLVAFEPMIIMQVGFQLSYAAVLGIVLIHPQLFNLLVFSKSRLLDWAWSITCVSIAAQVATAPLGLLYFHQFPNFFWVSNLLVIPAATVILYLGLLLFTFCWWKPTLLFFGLLLGKIVSWLNILMSWIERIPYSVMSGIDISTFETIIIYALIVGILMFYIHRSRFGIYASLSLAVLLVAIQILEVATQKNQRFITIYNVKGETAVALFDGTDVTFIASKELYENEQAMLFHVQHHWWRNGIATERFVELSDSITNRVTSWGNKTFAILDLSKTNNHTLNVTSGHQLDFSVVDGLSWNSDQALKGISLHDMYVPNKFGNRITDKFGEAFDLNKVRMVSADGAITIN